MGFTIYYIVVLELSVQKSKGPHLKITEILFWEGTFYVINHKVTLKLAKNIQLNTL